MYKKASVMMSLLLLSIIFTGCDFGTHSVDWINTPETGVNSEIDVSAWGSIDFFSDYSIEANEYGTETTVVVANNIRSITTNALPNHETWVFPNDENPNTISAQENSYELPLAGEFKDSQIWAREPWIAVNGIKFEPETNERVECESWETYRIEAKQEEFKVIWLDDQHAHVQPTGTYHYHWVSQLLIDFADTWDDLVHVWFAKDGFNIYYSRSWLYTPSYVLIDDERVGTSCAYRWTDVAIEWTKPDGTYVSDWIFDESVWDLDECNWIMVDGEYIYLMTDEYPYIGRCLNGESNEKRWPGWQWGPWWTKWWAWWPPPENDRVIDEEDIGTYFEEDALVEPVSVVDCTLSDETVTSCYKVVTTHWITSEDIGPWCPRNIADSAESWGIWLEWWEVHDVDGEFIKNLASFYGNDSWQLYDEKTWNINVTDSKEAFEWAAKPQVEEQYYNHCVEWLLAYVDEIPTVTYIFPVHPEKAEKTQGLSNPMWIAFNGIRFDAPAPVDAILAANTIAAFDDCGWHVNPHVWYHYHAETWCAPRVTEDKEHEKLIWFALDWFKIYEHSEEITDLDECGGHSDALRGYHYHIADAAANQHLWCLSWGYGCVLSEDWICDASAISNERRWPPPGQNGERRGPPQ